jgi:tetratricopeptide (TPR) repeat protein
LRSNLLRASSALLLLTTTIAIAPASSAATAAPARKAAGASVSTDDLLKSMVDAGNKAYAEKKYDQAETSFKNALKLTERNEGVLSLINRAMLYSNLGTTYFAQKKFAEAEAEYKSAIDLQEKLLSSHHAVVADTLQHYAALLRRMNRTEEADRIGTHAEMLKVSSLTGKDSDFRFEKAEAPVAPANPASSPSFNIDVGQSTTTNAPNSQLFSINRIVQMTPQDKSLLENPTTMEQPVYRAEKYWEGGMWDPFSGRMVGGEEKTRQVLDHYEKVSISSAKDLSYVAAVADLERRYQLSQSSIKQLLDAINSGGSAVEMSNGWLMVTNEDLSPNYWFAGTKVQSGSRPTESATYTIRTDDGKREFVGRRVSVLRNSL